MTSTLTKFRWLIIVLSIALLISLFLSLFGKDIAPVVNWLTDPGTPAPSLEPYKQTPYQPYVALQFDIDGPPLYDGKYAHEAAVAVANRIDASVPGSGGGGGMDILVCYISSHSFENCLPSYHIPAVTPFPPLPHEPVCGDNQFDCSVRENQYHKDLAAWKQTISGFQKELAAIRSQVKRFTDRLRNLPPYFDSKGSDLIGALAMASRNLETMKGRRVLLIASDLISTTSEKTTGAFSLSGIEIRVIWHSCAVMDAATCQANDNYFKQFTLKAGAKSFATYSVPVSEAEQITFQ